MPSSLQNAPPAGPGASGACSLEPLPDGGRHGQVRPHPGPGRRPPAGLRGRGSSTAPTCSTRRRSQRLPGALPGPAGGGSSPTPDRRLADLPLLSDQEAQRRPAAVERHRGAAYPHGSAASTTSSPRRRRAPRRPSPSPVRAGRLTYAELDARANRLAHHLRALGVGPETRVGLCLERSPELVVALLAVLKAGGAYVPLDPAYPPERLAFMLEDAGALAVLTAGAGAAGLPTTGGARLVRLDDPADAAAIAARPATAPRRPPRPPRPPGLRDLHLRLHRPPQGRPVPHARPDQPRLLAPAGLRPDPGGSRHPAGQPSPSTPPPGSCWPSWPAGPACTSRTRTPAPRRRPCGRLAGGAGGSPSASSPPPWPKP